MRSSRSRGPGMLKGAPGLRLFAACLLGVLLLVNTADAQQRGRPRRGGTVVIAGGADLGNFNSLINTEAWTREFIDNALFLRLVRLNPDLSYAPQLALSWRMTGDTGAIFRLRRDVFWQDGRRTSAHDVAFTFERIKDEATAAPAAEMFGKWTRAQVIDSFTIRFAWQPHVEPFFGWTQVAVMPKHALDSIPAARMRQNAFNKNPIGNGPFRLASYRANDRYVFEANPNFPAALGGRPLLERVIWRVIPDNNAQIAEIRTGQVDIITGPRAENVQALDAEPDIRSMIRPSNRYGNVLWNSRREGLNDARVRRALTLALNRNEMLTALRRGYGTLVVSPVPPFHWAFDRNLRPLPFDTVEAKRLLTQAGWVDRDNDGVRENAAGRKLEFELKVAANNQFNRDMGELIRAQVARVGVKLNIRPTDFPVMLQDITNAARNFDGVFLATSTDLVLQFHDMFHSSTLDNPFHSTGYSNPEVDRILDRARVTYDRKEASRLWRRFQRIVRDEAPATWLWWSPDLLIVRERLQGMQVDVRGTLITLPRWYVTN